MICGKELKTLKKHLLTVHSISTRKYLAKYKGALLVDPAYSEKMKTKRSPEDLENFRNVMKYKKEE
jgi:predicted transcriptional regulator